MFLKEEYLLQKDRSLSGIETQFLSLSQTANEKVNNYLSSLSKECRFYRNLFSPVTLT